MNARNHSGIDIKRANKRDQLKSLLACGDLDVTLKLKPHQPSREHMCVKTLVTLLLQNAKKKTNRWEYLIVCDIPGDDNCSNFLSDKSIKY